MKNRLINYLKAGYPAIAIQTSEEARVISEIINAAKTVGHSVATWSATKGLERITPRPVQESDTEDLLAACRKILSSDSFKNMVIIMRDVHQWPFDRDPVMARAMRDVIASAPAKGACIIFVCPEFRPWSAVEKLITMMDYSLPGKDDLLRIAEGIAESANKKELKANEDVIRALCGLSTTEAENALALSIVEKGTFDPEVIYREKVAAVKRSGLLEIVDPDPRGLDALGGLDNLKEWIVRRKRAYSPEAEKYGLPAPKGMLLVGVPGSGKSLSARVVGTALGIPTLKMDIGALFNSLVGESEARTRDALKLAEAMAPVVLWVDEVDKGLAGAQGNGSNDSGVTRRVFGTILSWMQERKAPVFVICTANQVAFLPPEFLRRGRFDEMFAVDLPTSEERQIIAKVLLKKKNRDPSKFNLKLIAGATGDYTGAEIEAVIDEAMFRAFEEGLEINTEHVVLAAGAVIPLAKTASEQINSVRQWSKDRARPASKTVTETNQTARKIKE